VGAQPPGTHATLGVFHDGRTREVAVTLGRLDEGIANAGPAQPGKGPSAEGRNPLGLVGQALDSDDRRQLGLKPNEGVGIASVEGLAARRAGLQPGDVVLQVGHTRVGNPAELDRALAGVQSGQTVMLLVRRGNASQFVAVTPRGTSER
jgi:serine protease Do